MSNNELKVSEIYKYSIKNNLAKNLTTQIYEIEVSECLKEYPVNFFVY